MNLISCEMQTIDIYVDGSFNGQNASWAYIVVDDNKVISQDSGTITDPELNLGWQIAGELQAVIEAIKYCKARDLAARIFYDYAGIEYWATGSWRAKKSYTIAYAKFMAENKEYIKEFVKIKSHTGNFWNEKVDRLAKMSYG